MVPFLYKFISFADKFRILLFPFAILYGVFISVKNKAYDWGFFSLHRSRIPLISVGNIRVGGTGKTPFIDFLIQAFQPQQIGIISKGYKRKSKGCVVFDAHIHRVEDVGDEAFFLGTKHPDTVVVVDHNRWRGMKQMMAWRNDLRYIISDDTYHHRNIVFDTHILLTDFVNMFYDDTLLPVGNLRECPSAYQRADVIIVSKCPPDLQLEDTAYIVQRIQPLAHQKIFFSTIQYGALKHLFYHKIISFTAQVIQPVILIHGIAQPQHFIHYIQQQHYVIVHNFDFPDHHTFTLQDVHLLITCFKKHPNAIIITTDKDGVKLKQYDELYTLPIYVLPITFDILFEQKQAFLNTLSKTKKNALRF